MAVLMRYAQQERWMLQAHALVDTLRLAYSIDKAKRLGPVVSKEFDLASWPELVQREGGMPEDGRTLWGYWDRGYEAMPDFCKHAVRSWELRNPDWKVVILDDNNYRQYVTPADLPSTYESLKVQHRSDLLSIAVLLRYGGVFLDLSTLLFSGLDEIWESLQEETLALTAVHRYPGTELDVYNSAILMTRGLNNPVLRGWQNLTLTYMEDPCLNTKKCLEHPAFERVRRYFVDPSLGVLKNLTPYWAMLWLLTDMIWFDKSKQQHVLRLPLMQWGFAGFAFAHYLDEILEEERTGVVIDSTDGIADWSLWYVLSISRKFLPYRSIDEPMLAKRFVPKVHAIKFSTLDYGMYVTEEVSTVSRIYDAAVDTSSFPTKQATLCGATRVQVSI